MPSQEFAMDDRGDPGIGAASLDISVLSGDPATDSPCTVWQAKILIGPYRLIEPIGSGGMGEVWLAEQDNPVRRHVALKLIKAGMDTGEVVARFRSEQQALALMDHPSIAKVFEAGVTPQGRPYFVMQYIAGVPITKYCDRHRLNLRERLELFVQVCDGIQHAHQKAIIHRDLKPSNVLVSELDGKPMPRIIDFGVAKAISHGLVADAEFTRAGVLLGTPGYVSPEQASSTGVDVDTRTDVYSLGVILYELLVGERPFNFHNIPLDEILRRLKEDEPPRASTKVRKLDDQSNTAAYNRASDPPTLARQLRGDLDAIILKSLEKDRTRRYGSPSELAADIRRYLNHEAVLAVTPSTAYRARKFARRYRRALVLVGACLLVLVLAATVTVWQSIQATKQSHRADAEAAAEQAVNDFLRDDLLGQASAANQAGPRTKPDPDLKVRTAVDRAASRIAGRFKAQPEVEAAIRDTIGQTYMDLGLYPQARLQLERALELHRKVLGVENPKTLKTMSRLGRIAYLQGQYAEAQTLLGRSLEIQRRVLGSEHPETLVSLNTLANVYYEEGNDTQAEALYRQIIEIRRRMLGPEDPNTLTSMNDLANVYSELGKYGPSEALHVQTLEMRRRVLGPEHPDTLISMHNLALIYGYEGKYAQAESLYSQTLEIQRRVLGSEHPNTLKCMNNLANVYASEGKYGEAEELFTRTLEIRRRVLGPQHPDTLLSMNHLAIAYASGGKYGQAEALFRKNLQFERRMLGDTNPTTVNALWGAIYMYQREGKYAAAETLAAECVTAFRKSWGSQDSRTITMRAELALAYVSERRFEDSEPLAREAFGLDRKKQSDDWTRFLAESVLGATLSGQKKYADAEPLLLEGYQGMLVRKGRLPVMDWYYVDRAREWIVQLYRAWGKPEKVAEWSKK